MLNLNAITVRLGGRTILDGATASLPPGGRVGLIGRNGAGKSTLMRVVAGLLDPDGGSAEMPRAARIGYIRSEERRVGKERRSRRPARHDHTKQQSPSPGHRKR